MALSVKFVGPNLCFPSSVERSRWDTTVECMDRPCKLLTDSFTLNERWLSNEETMILDTYFTISILAYDRHGQTTGWHGIRQSLMALRCFACHPAWCGCPRLCWKISETQFSFYLFIYLFPNWSICNKHNLLCHTAMMQMHYFIMLKCWQPKITLRNSYWTFFRLQYQE